MNRSKLAVFASAFGITLALAFFSFIAFLAFAPSVARAAGPSITKAILWDASNNGPVGGVANPIAVLAQNSLGSGGTKGVVVLPASEFGQGFFSLVADGVTPAISDTLITFTKNMNGTTTATQTVLTTIGGVNYRVQGIFCSASAGATANVMRVRFRYNAAGACTNGSSIVANCEMAPNYGTATASEGGSSCHMSIPEGVTITGDGTKSFCLSESAIAAAGTLSCTVIGRIYTTP
jgi:hypothetical protein